METPLTGFVDRNVVMSTGSCLMPVMPVIHPLPLHLFATLRCPQLSQVGCNCGNPKCRCPPIRYLYDNTTGSYEPELHNCADFGCPTCSACDERRTPKSSPAIEGVEGAETVLGISGMTCGKCVKRVKNGLQKLEGVLSVEVSLEPGLAKVLGLVRAETLVKAVTEMGYEATSEIAVQVKGMTCGKCVRRVQRGLEKLDGRLTHTFNLNLQPENPNTQSNTGKVPVPNVCDLNG